MTQRFVAPDAASSPRQIDLEKPMQSRHLAALSRSNFAAMAYFEDNVCCLENALFEWLFGASLGKTIDAIFAGEQFPTLAAAYQLAQQYQSNCFTFEMTKEGEIKTLFGTFIAQSDNAVLCLVTCAETEPQNRVQHASETTVITQLSHEIRTPLAGIIGLVEMLFSTAPSQAQKEILENAKAACDHLIELLNGIMDYSDAHDMPSQQRFRIPDAVEMVTQALQGIIGRNRNTFQVSIDPKLSPDVFGEANRLRQILFNLCGNSLKYTHNGHVELIINAGYSQQKSPGNSIQYVEFQIKDNGIGIDAQTLNGILKPAIAPVGATALTAFRRDSENPYHASHGIGLRLCQHYIQQMGGDLVIQSETAKPHNGTVASFSLPFHLASPHPNADTPYPTERHAETPRSILLVEDIPLNQMVIRHQLEKQGHTVCVASHGQEALIQFQNTSFDCIILDIQLPGQSGLELLSDIRTVIRRNKISQIPLFIALTANATQSEKEACLQAGFDYFLTKPLSYERLKRILNHPSESFHSTHTQPIES